MQILRQIIFPINYHSSGILNIILDYSNENKENFNKVIQEFKNSIRESLWRYEGETEYYHCGVEPNYSYFVVDYDYLDNVIFSKYNGAYGICTYLHRRPFVYQLLTLNKIIKLAKKFANLKSKNLDYFNIIEKYKNLLTNIVPKNIMPYAYKFEFE